VSATTPTRPGGGTDDAAYTHRLDRLAGARWKRLINAQAPYRYNVRRLRLGRTLDLGCGLGRNLAHLDGAGVGVDHNADSVAYARARGLEAYTVEEFLATPHATPAAFDSLLAAHLVEHLEPAQAREVVGGYLEFVRPGGKVVFITPQERGHASDETHVWFVDFAAAAQLCADLGLVVERQYSFPFPRPVGKVFTYNEFVTVARRA